MSVFKTTHRATTVMREAMEKAVRRGQSIAHRCKYGWDKTEKPVPEVAMKISDALHANAGVYRRKDVTLNLSPKTTKEFVRAGLFA